MLSFKRRNLSDMQTCYEVITDSHWEIIKEIVSDQRKRKYNLRDVLDAQFYILRTGTQWRFFVNFGESCIFSLVLADGTIIISPS